MLGMLIPVGKLARREISQLWLGSDSIDVPATPASRIVQERP